MPESSGRNVRAGLVVDVATELDTKATMGGKNSTKSCWEADNKLGRMQRLQARQRGLECRLYTVTWTQVIAILQAMSTKTHASNLPDDSRPNLLVEIPGVRRLMME